MVRHAMDKIGPGRQAFLLCDGWYPKGCVASLVDECHGLAIICNARIDAVMYDLPPGRTRKRGRPKKHGERMSPEAFELESQKTGDRNTGVRPALTRLWGISYAVVTLPKSGNGRRRLFFCAKGQESIVLGHSRCEDEAMRGYGEENAQFLPIACHSPRGNIEVSYREGKTLWPLEGYWARSREGIERLINLECVAYRAMTSLPHSDGSFSKPASAQEARFGIGQQIQASIIFGSFVEKLEAVKKSCTMIKMIEPYILSGFKIFKSCKLALLF